MPLEDYHRVGLNEGEWDLILNVIKTEAKWWGDKAKEHPEGSSINLTCLETEQSIQEMMKKIHDQVYEGTRC